MRVKVRVFNRLHYPIEVDEFYFPPGVEVEVEIERCSAKSQKLRMINGLRFGKNNDKVLGAPDDYTFNFVYDVYSQHRGSAYVHAIEALSNPIMKHLPDSGFEMTPGLNWNLRFFSEMRINQLGKHPVGPKDVFMSHGIGDKDYWIARRIAGFRHALVPGPAWKERILQGGYIGEVHVVGYTKLDPIFQGEYDKTDYGKPCVVWAPTHGYVHKHKGRSSYPECLTLIEMIPSDYETRMALHPTSRMKTGKQDVTMQELVDADVVIADAGSTLYEAWAIGKPVIFPDWICKRDVLAHFKPGNLEYEIYSKGIGYHAKDMSHLISLIDIALQDGMKDTEIEFMEQVFPHRLRGKAGQAAATALQEITASYAGR